MNKFTEALSLLDSFIPQKMQEYHTPGLAIAITNREQLLHISTYGKADIAANIPVTPETLFPMFSELEKMSVLPNESNLIIL